MSKKRAIAAFVINILIFLSTFGVVISYYCGNDGAFHISPHLRYCLFTTDSNIFCALTSIIAAAFEWQIITGKKERLPVTAAALKYAGTVAVSLTFCVVAFFLGPMDDIVSWMLGGTSVYMHTLGPLLAIISFLFLENGVILPKKLIPVGVMSMLIYGIVYLTMVVFIGENNGGWIDFYHFNIGGFWYISFLAVLAVTLLIASAERLIYNKLSRKLLSADNKAAMSETESNRNCRK